MVPLFYIAVTVLSTVASQILFKRGVSGISLASSSNLAVIIKSVLLNFYIMGGLFFSAVSIISWMFALSKVKLSYAYPFMSLTFPLVLLFSTIIFNEGISLGRWIGIFVIMVGLIIVARN
jgi:uncharacterized membrane protein